MTRPARRHRAARRWSGKSARSRSEAGHLLQRALRLCRNARRLRRRCGGSRCWAAQGIEGGRCSCWVGSGRMQIGHEPVEAGGDEFGRIILSAGQPAATAASRVAASVLPGPNALAAGVSRLAPAGLGGPSPARRRQPRRKHGATAPWRGASAMAARLGLRRTAAPRHRAAQAISTRRGSAALRTLAPSDSTTSTWCADPNILSVVLHVVVGQRSTPSMSVTTPTWQRS